MVHYPSGWCLFRRGRSFSGGPSVVVLGIVMRTNTTHFKDLLILNLYRLGFRNIKMLKRFLSGHWGFKNCGEFWFFAICRIWDSPTPGPLIPICRAFIFEGLRFPERPILPYLIQFRSRGFAGVMTSKIPQSKNNEVHHFRVQLFRRYMLPKYPDYAFRRHQNQIAVCSSSSQNKSANTNSLRTSRNSRASWLVSVSVGGVPVQNRYVSRIPKNDSQFMHAEKKKRFVSPQWLKKPAARSFVRSFARSFARPISVGLQTFSSLLSSR